MGLQLRSFGQTDTSLLHATQGVESGSKRNGQFLALEQVFHP